MWIGNNEIAERPCVFCFRVRECGFSSFTDRCRDAEFTALMGIAWSIWLSFWEAQIRACLCMYHAGTIISDSALRLHNTWPNTTFTHTPSTSFLSTPDIIWLFACNRAHTQTCYCTRVCRMVSCCQLLPKISSTRSFKARLRYTRRRSF